MQKVYGAIKAAKKFDELPADVREKLAGANVFFSRNHCDYVARRNEDMYFLYTDEYIIPVKIRRFVIIRYAVYLSEHYALVPDPSMPAKEFLNLCTDYIEKRLKAQWVETNSSGFFECFPKGSLVIPFGSHVIDLELDQAVIWDKMHRKHRNIIRHAEKNGVEVVKGGAELIDDYLLLDNATWKRSNMRRKSIKYYRDMADTLKDNFRIYLAYKENIPQAGAIFYFNRSMSYCMFASTRNDPEGGSSNLLHWTAIQDMKGLGVKNYSFVGCRINEDEDSKYNTLQRYKAKFGGELIRGYLFRKVFQPKMYRLFEIGMQLRSSNKMKRYQDAIDQEIHKWPELQDGAENNYRQHLCSPGESAPGLIPD